MKRFKLLKFLKFMLLLPIFPIISIPDGDEEEEEVEVVEDAEDEENTDEDEVVEEETEENIEETTPVDKKTHAIIKAKQKVKVLADENKKLQAELERHRLEEEKRQDANRLTDIHKKYVDEGWNDDIAKKMANQDLKLEQIERRQEKNEYKIEARSLKEEYPGIMDNLDRLIDLCKKTGWSLEKVASIELDKTTEYDRKIKNDQAEVAKSKATVPNNPTGASQKLSTIKLSSEDEAAYKYYESKNKGVTRKQYKERVLDPRRKRE